MNWNQWEPIDVLMVGLEAILIILLIGCITVDFEGDEEVQAVQNTIAAILAIIATYVGVRIERRRNGK